MYIWTQICIHSHTSIIHSCEHFPDLWALSTVVSIIHSCEHYPQLWAFSRPVSIIHSCEHYPQLWAFSRPVSIFQTCEHYPQLWALSAVVSIFQTCEQYPQLRALSTAVSIFQTCEHHPQPWGLSDSCEHCLQLWVLSTAVSVSRVMNSIIRYCVISSLYIRFAHGKVCMQHAWPKNAHKTCTPFLSFANWRAHGYGDYNFLVTAIKYPSDRIYLDTVGVAIWPCPACVLFIEH